MKDTREKIILTSFQYFLDKGYETTSMNDLVKVSRMSKGAFYHYFEKKEDILLATLESFFLNYFQELPKVEERFNLEDAVDVVWLPYAKMFEDLAKITPDLVNYYRYLFTGLRYFPELQTRVQETSQQTQAYLETVLSKARSQKMIRKSVDPTKVASQLIRLIEGTGLMITLDKQKNVRAIFTKHVHGFLDNLR